MAATYWHKQADQPLFSDLEWDKPERRDQAGNIAIIGGYVHNLNAPAKAYEIIKQTGTSGVKIVLPDKTKHLVGRVLPEAMFLPSTNSGEFSREGFTELAEQLSWADTMLLPGDIGRNSETTILLEEALDAYKAQAIITKDALDILSGHAALLSSRPRTTLIASFAQLQKLVKNTGDSTALQFTMDLVKLIEFLHGFTSTYSVSIVTFHQNQLIVAANGEVSTTKLAFEDEPPHWRVAVASIASCYQTWYPAKPFESLTHSVFIFRLSVTD